VIKSEEYKIINFVIRSKRMFKKLSKNELLNA